MAKQKVFNPGDRVELNEEWAEHCHYAPGKNFPVGRVATVVGFSRTPDCTRIVFEGQVTPQTFHDTFLTRRG